MKKVLLSTFISLAFILFGGFLFAQTNAPKMAFDTDSHDFGNIQELGGNVKHVFTFTNTGNQPIIIKEVKASCGCTTPAWSREPIAPGAKGFVSAKYNPINRPGKFNKSITVTSDAENSPITLRITGNVVPKKKKIEDQYRYVLENIRLKTTNISFGTINSNDIKVKKVEIINTSNKPVTLTFDKNPVPAHITVKAVPETLQPNQKGLIEVTFNASKKGDWDYVNDRINLVENGIFNQSNRLTVSATIVEFFSKKQLANPPVMTFLNGQDYEFGAIKEGDVVEHVFKFKNTGKTDLKIRKTRTSCGCTVVEPKNKTIKPGGKSELKVIFNSRGKHNKQTKVITVIVNVPGKTNNQNNSRVLLKMTGNVSPKQK